MFDQQSLYTGICIKAVTAVGLRHGVRTQESKGRFVHRRKDKVVRKHTVKHRCQLQVADQNTAENPLDFATKKKIRRR